MQLPLLWRSSLRYFRHHPWQTLLAILGVAIGVAVVIAVDLANESAKRSFALSTERLMGTATHQIVSNGRGVSHEFYRQLRVDWGYRDSAPVIAGYASLIDQPAQILQIQGGDVVVEASFRQYGTANQANGEFDMMQLMISPNTGVLSRNTAERLGISSGDSLDILAGTQQHSITILALFDDDSGLLDNFIFTDIATAQVLFDQHGYISRIDLRLNETQAIQLSERLPPDLRLEIAANRNEGIAQLTDSFHLNLTAMSLLALLVGMFLIYNSMTFAVVQRRRIFGQLRTLGTSRQKLFQLVLLEALLLGVIGTAIGIALGIALGSVLVDLVTRTVNDLYYTLTVRDFQIAPSSLFKEMLLGCGAPLLAAWLPAREAAQTPPSRVLVQHDLEQRQQQQRGKFAVLGIGIMLLGAACFSITGLVAGFLGLFLIVMGFALWIPLLVSVLMNLLERSGGGLLRRMAQRDVVRHLSRTAVAIAALMVALSATIGVGIMVNSFRDTIIVWLDDAVNAPIYLAPVSVRGGGQAANLEPTVLQALRDKREISAISTYHHLRVSLADDLTTPAKQMTVVDLAPQSQQAYRLFAAQNDAWKRFANGEILISEPLAYRMSLQIGDALPLATEKGRQEFSVAGIYADYGSEHGRILMQRETYQRFWTDQRVSSVAVFLTRDIDVDEMTATLQEELGQLQALRVINRAFIREISLEIFDRTFAITHVLRLLIIGVAVIGVFSALLALQLERSKTYAVLRAVGMSRIQIAQLVSLHSSLLGLLAGVFAIPLGLVMGWILIDVINRRAFGWTLQWHWDLTLFLQTVLLAVIAALLASLYPAWKSSRAVVGEALRGDH